jgi:hypothetical protein
MRILFYSFLAYIGGGYLLAEVPAVTAELMYRDGQDQQVELTGWDEGGPRLKSGKPKDGLVGVRFSPLPSERAHDGVGPLTAWSLPEGTQAKEMESGGVAFDGGKQIRGRVHRTLPELPERFMIRLRLRRLTARDLQFHFFAPETGYRELGMLGVGMGRNVSVFMHQTERLMSAHQRYPAPAWKDGLMEIELRGDKKAGVLALRVNRGIWMTWEGLEEDFPDLQGRMIRWQTLSKGGTLQIEKLLVTEWRGMLSGTVSAPFPIWQLRNGDRIHGQAISWDGKKSKSADPGRTDLAIAGSDIGRGLVVRSGCGPATRGPHG